MRGTQSLTSAFWLAGVYPAILILVSVFLIKKIFDADFVILLLLTFILTLPTRCFAWFSIFRCIGNTDKTLWSVLAGIVVTIDILHKLIYWPTVGFAYYDTVQRKARVAQDRERCAQELHKQSGFPETDISVGYSKSYPDDEEPYYKLYVSNSRREEYKCRVLGQTVSIERKRS